MLGMILTLHSQGHIWHSVRGLIEALTRPSAIAWVTDSHIPLGQLLLHIQIQNASAKTLFGSGFDKKKCIDIYILLYKLPNLLLHLCIFWQLTSEDILVCSASLPCAVIPQNLPVTFEYSITLLSLDYLVTTCTYRVCISCFDRVASFSAVSHFSLVFLFQKSVPVTWLRLV